MATKLLGDPVKQGQKLPVPGPGFDHISMVREIRSQLFFLEALKFLSHARSSTRHLAGNTLSEERKAWR